MTQRYHIHLRATLRRKSSQKQFLAGMDEGQLSALGDCWAETLGGAQVIIMPPEKDSAGGGELLVQGSLLLEQELSPSSLSSLLSEKLEELTAAGRKLLKMTLLSDEALSPLRVSLRLKAFGDLESTADALEEASSFEVGLARTSNKQKQRLSRLVAISTTTLLGGILSTCQDNIAMAAEERAHPSPASRSQPVDSEQVVGILYTLLSTGVYLQPDRQAGSQKAGRVAAEQESSPLFEPQINLRSISFMGSIPPASLLEGELPLAVCLGTTDLALSQPVAWKEVQALRPDVNESGGDIDLHWLVFNELSSRLNLEK